MAATLILARDINQANAYAKAVGLQRFTYRAVRSAASIRGIRHAEVHLLSSFLDRMDRHAIMAALRNARTLEVLYVDLEDFPEVPRRGRRPLTDLEHSEPIETIPDPRGVLTEEILDDAYATHFEIESARLSALVPSAEEAELAVRDAAAILTPEDIAELSEQAALDEALGDEPEEETDEPSGAPEPSEDPAPAEEPAPRRRRTRCKDCEELHLKDEPCEVTEAAAPVVTSPAPSPFDDFLA